MLFSEITTLFNQNFIVVGNKYRGKIPVGHSNPIYLVLNPLKLQNS